MLVSQWVGECHEVNQHVCEELLLLSSSETLKIFTDKCLMKTDEV